MQLLFSVTKKDLRIEYFSGTGPGGQNRNKRKNCCRILHMASGAVGLSTEERSQDQNKKLAFKRLTNNPVFLSWIKIEAAARLEGFKDINKKVEDMMKPENLKVEVFQEDKWIVQNESK